MIYIDTSVALAELFAEDIRPPESLWQESLVSSRLLEYEVATRVFGRGVKHAENVSELLSHVSFLELTPDVLTRALEPFPLAVRTLDALHLASFEFLRNRRIPVQLATYDQRMLGVARAMRLPLFELEY